MVALDVALPIFIGVFCVVALYGLCIPIIIYLAGEEIEKYEK